jgi:hypothetical protein
MKITFKKLKENELEEEKMRKFITLVAHELAIRKRGIKKEGYYYAYFTNPLRHKNYRGNTFIFTFELTDSVCQIGISFIGKRASFFNIGRVLEFADINFEQSDHNTLALMFNPSGQWILHPEEPGVELLKLRLYDYHTSTPQFWGMKWYEELKPCYSFYLTKYVAKYDINSLPVISSPGEEEEIRSDIKKCAVIYDHLARKPRAVVKYNDAYISNPNPPWWVEQQLY